MFVNGSGRNEQSLLCASYHVLVHLAKRFKRFFRNREIRIACGGHVCWQIRTKWAILKEDLPSFSSLAKGFQRWRLKCEKLTDAKWWQKLTLPLARWAKNVITMYFKNDHQDLFKNECQYLCQRFGSIKILRW